MIEPNACLTNDYDNGLKLIAEQWSMLEELESLGINAKNINELNGKQELGNLLEIIKQTMFQESKTCYD